MIHRKILRLVSNSSPIIGLATIGLLDLLWELFDEVFIPEAVFHELVCQSKNALGRLELIDAVKNKNIIVYQVKNQEFVDQFYGKLHKGELEVIIGAKELNADYLLLDEKTARNFALALSLEPTGLIGILILAKSVGKIKEIKRYLDLLIEKNYRIAKNLYLQILSEQGEL